MAYNNETFMKDVEAWTKKTKARLRLTNRELILSIGSRLIERSPVGDPATWESKPGKNYIPGTFKANWNGSFGQIDYSTTDETDPTGEVSFVRIGSRIPDDPTGVYWITNSLPYAEALENGHSDQAPAGMVGLTIVEFDEIFAASLAKAKTLA